MWPLPEDEAMKDEVAEDDHYWSFLFESNLA